MHAFLRLPRWFVYSVNDILTNWVKRPVLTVRARPGGRSPPAANSPTQAERERIARELHDTLLQGVQAIALRLNLWARDPRLSADFRAEIEVLARQSRNIVIEGRDRIIRLRDEGDPIDFLGALEDQATSLAQGRAQVLHLQTAGRERALSPRVADEVLAIMREALVNAFNHSKGSRVTSTVNYGARHFMTCVADDGVGIIADTLAHDRHSVHFGLIGMGERARMLGADLIVRNRLWKGSRVCLRIPAAVAYL